ncbi:MAG: AAA family ATPase [Defluviitaleaceae bacterium]|nr:AAA family ATPase [Defluviitaleaceae bacterium]
MKLVLIFGAIAVGKMTVAQELVKITDLRLFHNHMTIEPVIEIFGSFNLDVTLSLREVIFEKFVRTKHYGMAYTAGWDLDEPKDWEYFNGVCEHFTKVGGEVYFVNLVAPQEIRLARNETENRLRHKPSMRHKEAARMRLIDADTRYRWEALEGEFELENFIKIDNTNLEADEVAKIIKERFDL